MFDKKRCWDSTNGLLDGLNGIWNGRKDMYMTIHQIKKDNEDNIWVINPYSENNNIDLIVIGSNGRSAIEELFLGSTAKKVINKSRIPVLVVPLSD